MNRRYKTVRVHTNRQGLIVHFYVEVGGAIRFAEVGVPWAFLYEHHEVLANAIEQHFTRELKERWGQETLPLETWE